VISWGVVPLFRLVVYLASNPRLARTRGRAIAACVGFFAVVGAFLAVCPFPNRFRAPGVLEAVQYIQVINDTAGYVTAVRMPSGADVAEGVPLVELSDRTLELETEATRAMREETLAMQLRALRQETADLEPILKRIEAIDSKLEELSVRKEALQVKARQSGRWVAPDVQDWIGAWLQRGSVVGQIVNHGSFRFSAVVSQEEASDLFNGQIRKAEVHIHGQGGRNIAVTAYQIIPYRQERLPSAALGWRGGGEVPVSVQDQTGLRTTEPFFQIYATVRHSPGVVLLHGRSGKLRFTMTPKPLLAQWIHKFRQLLQKRYQI